MVAQTNTVTVESQRIEITGVQNARELGGYRTRDGTAVKRGLLLRTAQLGNAAPEELKRLEYRSKLDLTENVRIVEIGDVDRCACCAPHVSRTGEIGVIKILDCQRHRGGVRMNII